MEPGFISVWLGNAPKDRCSAWAESCREVGVQVHTVPVSPGREPTRSVFPEVARITAGACLPLIAGACRRDDDMQRLEEHIRESLECETEKQVWEQEIQRRKSEGFERLSPGQAIGSPPRIGSDQAEGMMAVQYHKPLKRWIAACMLGLLTGCAGLDHNASLNPGGSPGMDQMAQAMLEDPDGATWLLKVDHLDPLVLPRSAATQAAPEPALEISVAALETNYEIAFGCLCKKLNVTMDTPEVQNLINFIKSQSATGYFDLTRKPILNNPAGVTGVRFEPVLYNTTVELPTGGTQTFSVSGGLLMPLGIDKSKVKGVILYFHGTSFNKSTVGSVYTGHFETQLVSQVFASQGYIVAIPDYIGQGVDWAHVHPYVLYPKMTSKTGVDMLTAVKSTLAGRYGFAPSDPPLKLFSAGYSEGGANSVWFHSFVSSNPALLDPFFRLTHSVGMEGAYNTSQITKGYLFDDVSKNPNTYNIQNQQLVNMVKPLLSADAFLSYLTYSVNSDYLGNFQNDYFDLTATDRLLQSMCNVDGQHIDIASAFARPNTTISTQLLVAAFDKTSNNCTYPGIPSILYSRRNSIKALVTSGFLSDASQAKLDQTLREADVDLTPVPDGGVSIQTLAHDSAVVSNNFDSLLSLYPAKIKTAVKIDENQLLILSPYNLQQATWVPVDHSYSLVYQYLYALNTFNGF